ncbi:MAG: metallophosphoesterase [Oscillospiraceae bacterium]|jgi:predicted MPP superfamily phosphohydrolase|nr:metallophosphoesterase [Oscillospiraceae bacterium]
MGENTFSFGSAVAAGVAAMAAGGLFLWQQTNCLRTTAYTVPALPGFGGFTIAQVSDLHGKRFGKGQVRLLRRLEAARPDIICFTGDMAEERNRSLLPLEELYRGARCIAPLYSVEGNHEPLFCYAAEHTELLHKYGVHDVTNREELINYSGSAARIGGIGWAYPSGGRRYAFPEGIHLNRLPDILLVHDPNTIRETAGRTYLQLSGHMHGGQVALPGGRAILSPRVDSRRVYFPPYAGGIYNEKGTILVVSRGVGVSSNIRIRCFCRPELTVIRMQGGDATVSMSKCEKISHNFF